MEVNAAMCNLWQDVAGTIPACKDGDVLARVDSLVGTSFAIGDRKKMPTLIKSENAVGFMFSEIHTEAERKWWNEVLMHLYETGAASVQQSDTTRQTSG